jgi:hypothetical protein
MKLPDKHGSVMVNGSVWLELRGVATGVSAAAWQLACEDVRACEHAHAPLGQEEQGSTPAGAGVREQNAGGEREQPGADKVGRRGSIREARTPRHMLGRILALLECGEEACAVVSIGRPKAASMSSLERAGMSVAWPRRRAPRWHAGVFACVRTCGRTRALTWPDARAPRRKDILGSEVVRRGGRDLDALVSLEVGKATTGLARSCARACVQERDRDGARTLGEEGSPLAAKPRPVAGRNADKVWREREPKVWP